MATLLAGAPTGLNPAVIKVKINGKIAEALIDSGASEKSIDCKVVEELNYVCMILRQKFPWLLQTAQFNLLDKYVLQLKLLEIIID